jgi:NAD(P)-dependent dehydrogenase (short-subunit alcohol dehydrogenase family)
MGSLDGRVAVITGAGGGIGREHALLFAREGARVVVNDLGGSKDGQGADTSAAQRVVDEIVAAGGEALANDDNIADFDGAGHLIAQAIGAYGQVDVLVNNAGILRDAFLHRMTEDEWDLVIAVHLKGHFAPTRHAIDHWRDRAKSGQEVRASIINTASASGTFMPNPGQANYGAAKAAIAALTLVQAAELPRIGVRANAIAPAARTRMTEDVPMIGDIVRKPEDPDAFDAYDPRHVAPLVAYLAGADCPVNGKVFAVQGGQINELSGWTVGEAITSESDWTIDGIGEQLGAAAAA